MQGRCQEVLFLFERAHGWMGGLGSLSTTGSALRDRDYGVVPSTGSWEGGGRFIDTEYPRSLSSDRP